MDLQSLTFFKLTERHGAKFQAEKEDEYYHSAIHASWCLRFAYQTVALVPCRLLDNSRLLIRNAIRMFLQRKVRTG